MSVSLFRFLVLFLAACAAASRSTASVVCLCAVRWPRQHTQWVAEAKKKKKKVGLEIYDDLPPETAISNQTNGRIVCYYCARSHTRRAQHGTAHTTHIPKKSRPSIFNRMACFSSTLPPQLFRGFLSLSVWLDFHPQLGSKTFPSYALIVKMKTGPGWSQLISIETVISFFTITFFSYIYTCMSFISIPFALIGETNRYWKWLGPVGPGRGAKPFFTARFPWCSFRKRTVGRRRRSLGATEFSLDPFRVGSRRER